MMRLADPPAAVFTPILTPVTTTLERDDFAFLIENARVARAIGSADLLHLDQPIGILNYIRIANDIAKSVPPGRVLDWGCGFGQMTWLLRRRGFEVVPFDVRPPDAPLPDIPLCRDLEIVRTSHPTQLPFADASFDAVLSCGVLEHVDELSAPGNEERSLGEIRRVLRPAGWFPVYQLPQRHSWTEALQRRLGLGYSHPRRFTSAEIETLLRRNGFRVEWLRRHNMLPKNLTGLPRGIRNVYGALGGPLTRLDSVLSRIPGVNRLAGVLELLARRSG